MIAKLKGIVDEAGEDGAIVDVNGVGYLVFCSARTLARLPRRGEAVTLIIDTHVREDHIHLYGFLNEGERAWFRLLQTVQGVGARVALGILSALTPDDLSQAIAVQDKTALTRASGVGKKLAERVVHELKDKVGGLAAAPAAVGIAAAQPSSDMTDAVSALTHLGYRPAEASAAVSRAARSLGAQADVKSLITAGLKELAR